MNTVCSTYSHQLRNIEIRTARKKCHKNCKKLLGMFPHYKHLKTFLSSPWLSTIFPVFPDFPGLSVAFLLQHTRGIATVKVGRE